MKQFSVRVIAAAALLLSSNAMAANVADIKGYYLGVLGGNGQLSAGDFDESAISYGLYGGYYFSKNFAVESTYILTDNFVEEGDVKAEQLSLSAKFHHYFSPMYSMFIKAGMAKTNLKATPDFDGTGWLWGAGFNVAFSNQVNVRLAYEMLYTDLENSASETLESDLGTVYLGVHYQF
ncbi:porin family protein [Shewanella sp. Scap07]|uniref:outer membrane beta-barrel protein n=1 Tax=Shewanella sp. Scap07 TaxID=2589987 RepID=UPI0015BB48B0|nr:outer membrane beta-barrel protein [Shewanella sp. Scap07]QLE84808.1 porin family protein [Shewanella sp. Scap07]